MFTKKKPLMFTKKSPVGAPASGAINGNPDNAADAKKPITNTSVKSLTKKSKGKNSKFFA